MFDKSITFAHRIRESMMAARAQPSCMRHDDLYLVSYPKSGVTFLCHLLGCLEFNSGSNKVNFFNLHTFIPDIHQHKEIASQPGQNLGRRIIKSHASKNSNYRYVLHLVRDPIDVMVSYKNYWLTHYHKDIRFSDLIRSWRGIPRWVRHTESWLESEVDQRYIPVHYQTLLDHPLQVLQYVYECYGVSVSDQAINNAIALSSVENMRQSESLWSYGQRESFRSAQFVGAKKFSRDDVNKRDIDYIFENTSSLYTAMTKMCRNALDY